MNHLITLSGSLNSLWYCFKKRVYLSRAVRFHISVLKNNVSNQKTKKLFPPIGGCGRIQFLSEWTDSACRLMSPYYDLILNCNGNISIKLIKAIDASDAWTQGKNDFPERLRGVVYRDNLTNRTNESGNSILKKRSSIIQSQKNCIIEEVNDNRLHGY